MVHIHKQTDFFKPIKEWDSVTFIGNVEVKNIMLTERSQGEKDEP